MTNPNSPDGPKRGDIFVISNGDHAGQEIEVTGTNDKSVIFVPRRNGSGASMGKTKAGTYKELRFTQEEFATRTVRKEELEDGTVRYAKPYRREFTPTPKPVEQPSNYQPVTGIIDTHGVGVNMSIEQVTPLQAEAWLRGNNNNRNLVETRIVGYVAAMRRGEWRLVGDAIAFDEQGNLRNGQHRLNAVVRSGITCPFIVLRGVADDAFDVMDQGKPRGIADVLHLNGHKNSLGLAGAIRLLMILEARGRLSIHGQTRAELVTGPTTLAYVENHPEVQDGFRMAESVRGAGLGGGVSLWAAMFTLFYRISPEAADEFRSMLATGTGPGWGVGHPALTLRNRAIKDGREFTKSEQDKEELGAYIIKAWNAYRRHKKITVLVWRTEGPKAEGFPTPI